MTIATAVLGVLLALALLLILALLRSHAEILRRLAALEAADGDPGAVASRAIERPRPGGAAIDITGRTLAGDAVAIELGAGAPATLLAFMGTGCNVCAPLWAELHGDRVPTPAGARLVVVTKGPERERLARLLELAPATTNVVMSTEAWSDYAIPATPHFVLVRDGEIVGRGSASSWAQITAFLTDAADDDRIHRARALATDGRAARAERALAQAGIGPEHPSLYPSRREAADE